MSPSTTHFPAPPVHTSREMAANQLTPARDGFHHPASEAELAALVKLAHTAGRQLRVRGAAHSVVQAVYTDLPDGSPDQVDRQVPPRTSDINVMLDRYRSWRVRDEGRRLVEADAGISLGGDPSDPTGTASVERSLLAQLHEQKRWTLSATGGITHQTISGFTASGSAGGSLRFSASHNLFAFRIIDGTGEVREFSRDDPDPDLFYALAPSLGLLGVVSTITLECVETFNIEGHEAVTTLPDCTVDVFGDGDHGKPSLAAFLQATDYARLEWWPQRGAERVLTWQAARIPPVPGFKQRPFREFTDRPLTAERAISPCFMVLANVDDLSRVRAAMAPSLDEPTAVLEWLPWLRRLGVAGRLIARCFDVAAEVGIDAGIAVLTPFAPLLKRELPTLVPRILDALLPLDDAAGPQTFRDVAWQGMPMDNAADDALIPTTFTELWIPLLRTREAVCLLNAYFTEPEPAAEAYRRTGLNAFELYSAAPTSFWLSPSYTAGDDEWRDGAFRIDSYWSAANVADPADAFYPQFWNLMRAHGVPFRLHWGKVQPHYATGDREWVDFFRDQYPRWDDFLALRAERDPNNIFLTGYWRARFGLWDAPAPRPITSHGSPKN